MANGHSGLQTSHVLWNAVGEYKHARGPALNLHQPMMDWTVKERQPIVRLAAQIPVVRIARKLSQAYRDSFSLLPTHQFSLLLGSTSTSSTKVLSFWAGVPVEIRLKYLRYPLFP